MAPRLAFKGDGVVRATARSIRAGLVLLVAGGLLAACAETEFLIDTAKRIDRRDEPKTAQTQMPSGYKLGRPYQIAGVWYYPTFDAYYDETGIASWYGQDFHGRPTANGERYDMNELTAAHKTLPLPSRVRVTNLENGRALILRVNDRGPFVAGRIIDVSRRGAQLLGFHKEGVAKVRVEYLDLAPVTMLASKQPNSVVIDSALDSEVRHVKAVAPPEVAIQTIEAPPTKPIVQPAGIVKEAQEESGGFMAAHAAEPPSAVTSNAPTLFIQVGAFTDRRNAMSLSGQLASLGQVIIAPAARDGLTLYRVRIGPIASLRHADDLLDRLIRAGFSQSQLIVAR